MIGALQRPLLALSDQELQTQAITPAALTREQVARIQAPVESCSTNLTNSSTQSFTSVKNDHHKACESQIKDFTSGSNIFIYNREAGRILNSEGVDVSEDEKIAILRKKVEADTMIATFPMIRRAGCSNT